ncbi:hypothetical protein SAY86_022374 [Trapa natans]|uniref:Uncharacterized protein n=1 Tax=Trapa natans TaxID=22666 RepID=A0AAN7LVL3_TRANT|nr:hypothetical protein SAY86_022374 [Trapa natans]
MASLMNILVACSMTLLINLTAGDKLNGELPLWKINSREDKGKDPLTGRTRSCHHEQFSVNLTSFPQTSPTTPTENFESSEPDTTTTTNAALELEAIGNHGPDGSIDGMITSSPTDHDHVVINILDNVTQVASTQELITVSSEPPSAAVRIFTAPPIQIIMAGAFQLLSTDPSRFQNPILKVLLGNVLFCFVTCIIRSLMGGHERMRRVSSILEWSTVLSLTMAFFLIIIPLFYN